MQSGGGQPKTSSAGIGPKLNEGIESPGNIAGALLFLDFLSASWYACSIDSTEALAYIEPLYEDRRDKLGYPEIAHVHRVAAKVSRPSRVVAILHDTVEDGLTTFLHLYYLLDAPEFEALLLLTRTGKGTYMDYIRRIKVAPGIAGAIAREVKKADLMDNMQRDCPEDMRGMREPGGRYDRALKVLRGDAE